MTPSQNAVLDVVWELSSELGEPFTLETLKLTYEPLYGPITYSALVLACAVLDLRYPDNIQLNRTAGDTHAEYTIYWSN